MGAPPRNPAAMCAAPVAGGGDTTYKVLKEVVYHKHAAYDGQLEKAALTTMKAGSTLSGTRKPVASKSGDGSMWVQTTVDTGERTVYVFVPMHAEGNPSDVFLESVDGGAGAKKTASERSGTPWYVHLI